MRKNVSTIAEFVEWVEEIGDRFTKGAEYEAPWFRGHGSQDHALTPGLYRTEAGRSKFGDDELRNEFMRRAAASRRTRA